MADQVKNLYQVYKTEPKLETEGVTLDFGGPKFIIRRAGGANRKFSAVFNERVKPHQRAVANGTLPKEKSDEIMQGVYFDTIIVGWENVADEHNNPMEFNRANFFKLMTDLPDLWDEVRAAADDRKSFQLDKARDDGEELGNS